MRIVNYLLVFYVCSREGLDFLCHTRSSGSLRCSIGAVHVIGLAELATEVYKQADKGGNQDQNYDNFKYQSSPFLGLLWRRI